MKPALQKVFLSLLLIDSWDHDDGNSILYSTGLSYNFDAAPIKKGISMVPSLNLVSSGSDTLRLPKQNHER